ncbi:hypothetical protein IscW_ISCW021116 [Ixodes scapularis]|uniref:Uncharacterized protein n=1 Tax=Ixodes scapularis TaxID=6945 RepID=B7Q979_IXOSC|nr:hypothetical protein IscW_ISCW021116 [Ixodes scapularis]|eukprot:XP_002405653.1 hypothetical protein IscW_ISCW021116 [Ixodes scapularis]
MAIPGVLSGVLEGPRREWLRAVAQAQSQRARAKIRAQAAPRPPLEALRKPGARRSLLSPTPSWRPGIAASSWHGPKEESGPGASDTARSASPSTQPPAPTPDEEYLGGRILPVR